MNSLQRQIRLFPERGHQGGSALHRTEPAPGELAQLTDVPRAEIAKFMGLEMAKEVFDRIELRRIGRQELNLDLASTGFNVLPNHAALMYLGAIPNDEQLFPDLALECLEKLHALRRPYGAGKQSEVEVPEAHPGDDRQLLPREAVLDHRCLATGAQVRTRVGRSESPDSSTNTITRPSFAAFFLVPASACASTHVSPARRAARLAGPAVGN